MGQTHRKRSIHVLINDWRRSQPGKHRVRVIIQDRAMTSAFQAYPPAGVIFTGIASLLSVGVYPANFHARV